MFFSSRFTLTTAFSLLLLIFVVSPAVSSSTRITTHAAGIPLKFSTKSAVTSLAPASCGTWSVVSSPNPGTQDNYLYGVATVSATDVWAVGYSQSNGQVQTLTEYWNGSSWSVVPSPNPGSNNVLHAVTQVPGTNQAWSVGVYTSNSSNQTLIEHWDGTSWSVVSSPNPGAQVNVLFGVAALSATDVWAVGNYYNTGNGPTLSLIEHWDGISWNVVSNPNPGVQYNYLEGITAISARNVWTVGEQVSGSTQQTLTEHWNGSKWNVIPSPNVGLCSDLRAVVQVPFIKQVWAVGIYSTNNTQVLQTLIEHWGSKSWSIISSPNVGSYENTLNGVAAISKNNVWAVGYDINSNDNYNHQTLTEHWDGSSWSVVSSPNPGTVNVLSGVAQVPGTNQVWALGYDTDSNGTYQTLTEFYC